MTDQTSHAGRQIAARVVVWSGLLVLLSLAAMSFAIFRVFDAAIQPELLKRSQVIATSLSEDFERAMNFGIPIDAIAGVNQFLAERLDAFQEVDRVSLVSRTGVTIAAANRYRDLKTTAERAGPTGSIPTLSSTAPIFHNNERIADVQVLTDPSFLRVLMRDIVLDVMVVTLVAMLLAFELVQWVVAASVAKPFDRVHRILREQASGAFTHAVPESAAGILRRIARRLSERAFDLATLSGKTARLPAVEQPYFVDIRLPLFLYSTATEISASFLPIYARDAGAPSWMTSEMAATAPLIAYLAAIAVMAPFAAGIVNRFGMRRVFLSTAPITALALIGVGFGQSTLAISLWIGAMAVVYALATTACHSYVISTATPGEDAKAMSSYLFVIIAGAFCGSAFGGVLADRIGTVGTFVVGAAMATIAGLLGALTILSGVKTESAVKPPKTQRGRPSILHQPRFLALTFGIAVPLNLGMSVFIWYVVPLALEQQGARSADIGRVIMLYYLIPLLVGPTAARLADGRVGCVPLLTGGMALSGVALALLAVSPGFWPMVAAVSAFGFGAAMCEVSQNAHAYHIASDSSEEGAVDKGFAALRLIERVAAIIGLVIGASLAARFGFPSVIGAISATMLLGAVLVVAAESAGWWLKSQLESTPKVDL